GLELAEVALDHFQDVGVGNRRRGALVFAQFADDLVRQCDAQLRVSEVKDLADAQLVLWMSIGVQQANTNSANGVRAQLISQPSDRILVQRSIDGAVGENALGDGEGTPAWYKRHRFLNAH